MLQNQTNPIIGNMPMPLLMNFTVPTRIEEGEIFSTPYDEVNQIVYNMGIVGTKSLKTSSTRIEAGKSAAKTDKKNEIDDQKIVK